MSPRHARAATRSGSLQPRALVLGGAGVFAVVMLGASRAADASPDAATLTVRVTDPPSVPFDATALGKATHLLRLVLTNTAATSVQLAPVVFRFRPVRDGIVYECSAPETRDGRYPSSLDAGASFTLDRTVSCETPLPGRYDVEILGRARSTPEGAERSFGWFALNIEPGANPPVRLPWDPSLHAAASGTKEMRPTDDPRKARIVVALSNGTHARAALSPLRATMKIARRGSTVAPCPPRSVDLPFTGSLAPGRSQSLTTPLGCEVTAEAIYDIDISVANAAGAHVHLASHALRVGVLPPPPPRGEDSPGGRVIGGM